MMQNSDKKSQRYQLFQTSINSLIKSQTQNIQRLKSSIQQIKNLKPNNIDRHDKQSEDKRLKMQKQYLITQQDIKKKKEEQKRQGSMIIKTKMEGLSVKNKDIDIDIQKQRQLVIKLQQQIDQYYKQLKQISEEIQEMYQKNKQIGESQNNLITKYKTELTNNLTQQLSSSPQNKQLMNKITNLIQTTNKPKNWVPSIIYKLNNELTETQRQLNYLQNMIKQQNKKIKNTIYRESQNNTSQQTLQAQLEILKNKVSLSFQEKKWKQEELARITRSHDNLVNPQKLVNSGMFEIQQSVILSQQGSKSPQYWAYVHSQAMKRVKVQVRKQQIQINKQKKAVKILWNFLKQTKDQSLKQRAENIIKKYNLAEQVGI